MRVAITGATGVLGRNLLFELIKRRISCLDSLEIFVLGRGNGAADGHSRVRRMILRDGLAYLAAGRGASREIMRFVEQRIRSVEADLNRPQLGVRREDRRCLGAAPIDYFFHSAALTDLRNTRAARQRLHAVNVEGTKHVLSLASSLEIREFCNVASAYCCGIATGGVPPDSVSVDQGFRNPYEESKLRGEIAVRQFAAKTGTRCRYFRPSVLCGRLIEQPLGAISKFGVFYAMGAFILRMKASMLPEGADVHREPVRLDMRGCCDLDGGLNVVPVDYAAKLMVELCLSDDPGESYHIVSDSDTAYRRLASVLLRSLNVTLGRISRHVPADRNRVERLYYRTVGGILTPYCVSAPMSFDTVSTEQAARKGRLRCPPLDEVGLNTLIAYALKQNFGLSLRAGGARRGSAA